MISIPNNGPEARIFEFKISLQRGRRRTCGTAAAWLIPSALVMEREFTISTLLLRKLHESWTRVMWLYEYEEEYRHSLLQPRLWSNRKVDTSGKVTICSSVPGTHHSSEIERYDGYAAVPRGQIKVISRRKPTRRQLVDWWTIFEGSSAKWRQLFLLWSWLVWH